MPPKTGEQKAELIRLESLPLPNIPLQMLNMKNFSPTQTAFPILSGGNILPKRYNGEKTTKIQTPPHSMVLIYHALAPVGLTAWLFLFGFVPN